MESRLLLARWDWRGAALLCPNALAQKKYGTGASDTEIKIGQTMPYSGPASAYGAIGRAEVAYFQMINDQGGINGRKINLISLDDAYSVRRKTVEQIRTPGRAGPGAVRVPDARHAQQHGDPQVRQRQEGAAAVRRHRRHQVGRSAELSLDHRLPAELPRPNRHIYAKYVLQNSPTRRSPCCTRTTTTARTTCKGLQDGARRQRPRDLIVKEASYEVTDPTVDSQIVTLQASGADTLVHLRHAQVRRPGDPQDLRHRLAAAARSSTTYRPRWPRCCRRPAWKSPSA